MTLRALAAITILTLAIACVVYAAFAWSDARNAISAIMLGCALAVWAYTVDNPGPRAPQPYKRGRRANGFTMLEMAVVVAMLIVAATIGLVGMRHLSEWKDQRVQDVEAKKLGAMVEVLWAQRGIDGPESARLEMAAKVLDDQGVNRATVTDWSRDGLAARVPSVITPEWTTQEALDLMGWETPKFKE